MFPNVNTGRKFFLVLVIPGVRTTQPDPYPVREAEKSGFLRKIADNSVNLWKHRAADRALSASSGEWPVLLDGTL